MTACCRFCCKSILSILSRNIDSRSGANAQQRFKKPARRFDRYKFLFHRACLTTLRQNRHERAQLGMSAADVSILIPSLSSSPWMRGAPHNGLALLMRRIKARMSAPILGHPDRRDRHRQKSRKPLRCHWITVVGLTKTIASMTCGQIR